MEYSVLYLCNSLENFILTQSLKAVYWKIHGSEASKRKKKSVKHERKDEKKKIYIYCIWLFLYRGLCDLLTCFHTTARYISIKNKFSLSIKYNFSFSFIHEKSNLCYRAERPAVVPFKDWEDMELMMMLKGMKEAWT